MKNMQKKYNGFTLVELLIVIAVIGILSSIVLVSSGGARDKSKRAAALTTASSALPEIVTCQDDNGTITAYTGIGGTGAVICAATGHTTTWGSLGTTGWTYNIPAKTNAEIGTIIYRLAPPTGQLGIMCDYASNTCCDDNTDRNKANC